jgi:hypothetical protein
VPRYGYRAIPEHMREMIARNKQAIMNCQVETALNIYDFEPESVVGRIATRPLLLMHAAKDSHADARIDRSVCKNRSARRIAPVF